MICSNCANLINDTDKFCQVCGASVDSINDNYNAGNSFNTAQSQAKSKNRKTGIILSLISLFLIIFIVTGASLSYQMFIKVDTEYSAAGNDVQNITTTIQTTTTIPTTQEVLDIETTQIEYIASVRDFMLISDEDDLEESEEDTQEIQDSELLEIEDSLIEETTTVIQSEVINTTNITTTIAATTSSVTTTKAATTTTKAATTTTKAATTTTKAATTTTKATTTTTTTTKATTTTQASSSSVSVDLSSLSGNSLITKIDDLYNNPSQYYGLTIKMTGSFSVYQDPNTGTFYFALIMMANTMSNARVLEFVLDGATYPNDYPILGQTVTVIGTFAKYVDGSTTYYHLENAYLA